jgi:hypothetical protein
MWRRELSLEGYSSGPRPGCSLRHSATGFVRRLPTPRRSLRGGWHGPLEKPAKFRIVREVLRERGCGRTRLGNVPLPHLHVPERVEEQGPTSAAHTRPGCPLRPCTGRASAAPRQRSGRCRTSAAPRPSQAHWPCRPTHPCGQRRHGVSPADSACSICSMVRMVARWGPRCCAQEHRRGSDCAPSILFSQSHHTLAIHASRGRRPSTSRSRGPRFSSS